MHTGAIDSNEILRERLKAIADSFPDMAQTAQLYGAILPILRDEEIPVLPTGLSQDEVRARLEQGLPYLEGLELEVDLRQAAGLLVRLAGAAEKAGARVSAAKVGALLDEERDVGGSAAFQAILTHDDELLGNRLEQMGLDRDLCGFLARTALKPLLRAWCRLIAPLAADVKWDRGTCFVCGSAPLLAELQGNDQERHLRCGLCGADWRIARLSCPHCGTEDHRSLKVFFQNDPAGPRIEACDQCMTYVKVIPAFSPTPADLMPVEDLATIRLDAFAQERGYRRAAAAS
jgi:formate dehydrogenase accessory protein FdhE